MSLRLRALNLGLRLSTKPYLRYAASAARLRRITDRMGAVCMPQPQGIRKRVSELTHDGRSVPVSRFSAGPADTVGVVLYFHGGAYCSGSMVSHAGLAGKLADLTGIDVLLPEYRLTPEHPFPAAIEDALTCYRALLAQGHDCNRIAIGGESSGGGLALGLLHSLIDEDSDLPACTFAISPWTDLSLSGRSIRQNAGSDVMLPSQRLREAADLYLAGASPRDPRASPLFGSFTGAGPVLFQVSRAELLYEDSRRLARIMQAHGCDVTLTTRAVAPHAWPIFYRWIPEARDALKEVAQFIRRRLKA